MISYVRGPGGIRKRLAAEFVPFCVAATGGWVVGAIQGLVLGVLAGLVLWLAVSLLLRSVRKVPRLCLAYRLALVAHVVFWTWQGLMATYSINLSDRLPSYGSSWSREVPFSAGYAEAPFDLPESATLAGWGSRPRRVGLPPFAGFGPIGKRVQDWMGSVADAGPRRPLFHAPDAAVAQESVGARALVLRPQGERHPVAIIRLDLVTSDAALTEAIQSDLSDLGFRPESVIVAASHTHSGPGGYAHSRVSALLGTDHFDSAAFAAIRVAAVKAVRRAHGDAVPARLAVRMAHDAGEKQLARLRGRNAEKVERDDRVYAMHVAAATGAPIATVVQYAVHPTLVRRQHMGFARDLVGALEEALPSAWPGTPPVLFLNGALGDVAPEGRHGSGPEAATTLAEEFRDTVGAALAPPPAQEFSSHLQVAMTRRVVRLDRAAVVEGFGDRMRLDSRLSRGFAEEDVATDIISLPANMLLWSFGLTEMRVGFDWHRAAGVRIALPEEPRRRDCGAWEFSHSRGAGKGAPQRLALLWFPGEATTALGAAWRERAGPDAPVLLVGLANGSLAYLTTPAEFAGGGYEAVATVHGPQAGREVGEALRLALEEARRLRWR